MLAQRLLCGLEAPSLHTSTRAPFLERRSGQASALPCLHLPPAMAGITCRVIPSKTELPQAVSFSLWAPVRVRAMTQCHTGPSSAFSICLVGYLLLLFRTQGHVATLLGLQDISSRTHVCSEISHYRNTRVRVEVSPSSSVKFVPQEQLNLCWAVISCVSVAHLACVFLNLFVLFFRIFISEFSAFN